MNTKSRLVTVIIWALVALILGAVAYYVVLGYSSFELFTSAG